VDPKKAGLKERAGERGQAVPPDELDYPFGVRQDFMIPEPHHAEPLVRRQGHHLSAEYSGFLIGLKCVMCYECRNIQDVFLSPRVT